MSAPAQLLMAARGDCRIEVSVTETGVVSWSATHRGLPVCGPAPLRLTTVDGKNMLSAARVVGSSSRPVVERYQMAVGKRIGDHEAVHEERVIRLATVAGQADLVLRAADDGVALRLVLHGARGLRVRGADVELTFPADAPTWPLEFTTWYETTRFATTLETLAPGDYGFPLLVETGPGLFALVTESDLDGRYGGSLARYLGGGRFDVALVDDVELDADVVATPWRVVIMGDLATVVATDLVNELAPAAAAPPPPWVRPGRSAWSWWSDFYSGAQQNEQLRLLDYAVERGWEYLLVDCGWDAAWMPDLVAAASERGVGIFVWVPWDHLLGDGLAQLADWAAWGVAGIKVDFMESESQERYRWYDRVIAECARLHLMVNFHGSVIPRGWQRSFPHVVSFEAVRGAEYYVFYGEPLTPEHNTIVPFTRNVVGSADYTPVTFSARDRVTSEAHELALAVVLESGVQHFADRVTEYTKRPLAEALLSAVPAAWHETRYVAGHPGRFAALARRHGRVWFVGVVSAERATRLDLPLDFLPGPAHGEVLLDGGCGLTRREITVAAGDVLSLDLVDYGGAVVVLRPPGDAGTHGTHGTDGTDETGGAAVLPVPRRRIRVLDPLNGVVPGGVTTVSATVSGSGPVRLVVPPGWPDPVAESDGGSQATSYRWRVGVPDRIDTGSVAVLTVLADEPGTEPATANSTGGFATEADRGGGPASTPRPTLAHARRVAPPRAGLTPLTALPYIHASNGYGPVEHDTSNGGGDPRDGRPMSIGGMPYGHGLGVCAPSEIRWFLGGVAQRLHTYVGVDDETDPAASAVCRVVADGRILAETVVSSGDPAVALDVDLRGARLLSLVVEAAAEGGAAAHVDWAGASLVANDDPSDPTPHPSHVAKGQP